MFRSGSTGQFSTLRRYTPDFPDVLTLRAAPAAQDVLDAIAVIRTMNSAGTRKVPIDAPTAFIKPRTVPATSGYRVPCNFATSTNIYCHR